jgi:hypothetical protein
MLTLGGKSHDFAEKTALDRQNPRSVQSWLLS